MKNSTYLIIILVLALVGVSYKWISSSANTDDRLPSVRKSTIDDIMTRTSVRIYSDIEVTAEQVDTILRAAMAAPTAANKQPWRFVVINDKAILDSISNNFKTMTMAKDASLAIIVCGDLDATLDGEGRDFWIEDTSAASENILLAAHAMDLGTVWCGIYPQMDRVARFSTMLDLPETIIPLSCICIGHPVGEPVPKDKWHPEYIHYNSWNGAGAK